jgi:hypothetical protein
MCREREHEDNEALDHASHRGKTHRHSVPLSHLASLTVSFRISERSGLAYAATEVHLAHKRSEAFFRRVHGMVESCVEGNSLEELQLEGFNHPVLAVEILRWLTRRHSTSQSGVREILHIEHHFVAAA